MGHSFQLRPEGYVGKQFATGYSGYVIADGITGIFSVEDGVSDDDGKVLLEKIKDHLLEQSPRTLGEFESAISGLIMRFNLPAHVSFAFSCAVNGVLYVKTVGKGCIYLRRGSVCQLLIRGDQVASGNMQSGDTIICTTDKIEEVIGTAEDITAFIGTRTPPEIIDHINREEYGEEDVGFIGLFVQFMEKSESSSAELTDTIPSSASPQLISAPVLPESPSDTSLKNSIPSASDKSADIRQTVRHIVRNKWFVTGTIVIFAGLLTWSVFTGTERRSIEKMDYMIDKADAEIQLLLADAQETAFLDLAEAQGKITQAQSALASLQDQYGDKRADRLKIIDTAIRDAEARIMKKEDKAYTEFFDFGLTQKEIKVSRYANEADDLAVLDAAGGRVYVLNLQKKSVTQYVHKDVEEAIDIALYRGDPYLLHPTKGVVKFTARDKTAVAYAQDASWGDIVDLEIYNGNLYLLDESNDEVWRHSVIEGGYAAATAYFGSGQDVDIADSGRMTIDGSVYLISGSRIYQYLRGVQQKFAPSLPSDKPAFDDMYTDNDVEQIYVLDNKQGALYVIAKTGTYDRQISASILKEANGIYVYENALHVIVGAKVFSIGL